MRSENDTHDEILAGTISFRTLGIYDYNVRLLGEIGKDGQSDRHVMFKYALRTADTNDSDSAWRSGGQNYGLAPGWKRNEWNMMDTESRLRRYLRFKSIQNLRKFW